MNVFRYVRRRLLLLFVVLFGLSVITFVMVNLTPVDPVILWGGEKTNPEVLAMVRREFGLDQPYIVQYFRYIQNLFKGNLGVSISTRHPVAQDITAFFPATLELVVCSWVIAILVGVPLGVISAVRSGKKIDVATRMMALGGVSTPLFWLGMLLQIVLFKQLGWLPLQGRIGDMVAITNPIQHKTGLYLADSLLSGNTAAFGSALRHLIMPALTLSVQAIATTVRMTRSCMMEIIGKDYMQMAASYGLPKWKVFFKYGLKNALIPIVTIISMAFCGNLMGSILVETVFDWPGIGRYMTRCILNSDFAPVMGVVLMMGCIYVVINLFVDIFYVVIDKRISYDGSRE